MCNFKFKNVSGMVLLEMMIASGVALCLIAGMTSLYLKMHGAQLSQRQILQQQITAEKITSIFKDEIALAGQIGCAKLRDNFNVYGYAEKSLTAANKLEVYADGMTVRYQSYPGVLLQQDADHSRVITTDRGVLIQNNVWLIISNCQQAEIVYAVAVKQNRDTQIITLLHPLRGLYQKNSEIGRFIKHEYQLKFISGHSALIRIDDAGNVRAIAKDIENLHFKHDERGVQFEFTTSGKKFSKQWVGYAEKN